MSDFFERKCPICGRGIPKAHHFCFMCKAQRRKESKQRSAESRLLDFDQHRRIRDVDRTVIEEDTKLRNLPNEGHGGAKEVYNVMQKIVDL